MKLKTRFSTTGGFIEVEVDTPQEDVFSIEEAEQLIENLQCIVEDLKRFVGEK